eukprot:7229428-Alexandrium_andersonii.AAC.1
MCSSTRRQCGPRLLRPPRTHVDRLVKFSPSNPSTNASRHRPCHDAANNNNDNNNGSNTINYDSSHN